MPCNSYSDAKVDSPIKFGVTVIGERYRVSQLDYTNMGYQ